MAICEFTKNGKIVKSRIETAMKLLKDEIIMLERAYNSCMIGQQEMEGYNQEKYKFVQNKELTKLYLIQSQLCSLRREMVYEHSYNLYRFFYGIGHTEDKDEEDAEILFYYNYPINKEKFEKERVKQNIMDNLIKKKKNEYIEINLYTQKNIKVFYNNLLEEGIVGSANGTEPRKVFKKLLNN